MGFPEILRWRRSQPLAALIVLVHLVAAIALAVTSLPVWWIIGGALLIAVSAFHAGVVWRSAAGDLRLHADGRCDYRPATRGEFSEARLRWHSEWPIIASIGIETVDPPAKRVLIAVSGALSGREQRLLRLWLRCCAAGDGAGRGQGPG